MTEQRFRPMCLVQLEDKKVEMAISRLLNLMQEYPTAGNVLRDISNTNALTPLSSPFVMSVTPSFEPLESPWNPPDSERVVCVTVHNLCTADSRTSRLRCPP